MECKNNTDWKFATKNHMITCVRWQETMEIAKNYEILEIGLAPILSNMAKRDGINIKYMEEEL